MAQQLIAVAIGRAVTIDLARADERVRLSLPRHLRLAGALHALANRFVAFRARCCKELALARSRHLQLDVDAVRQRTGNPAAIAGDALGRAAAAAVAIAAVPAGTGIHGCDELEARGKLRLARGAGD